MGMKIRMSNLSETAEGRIVYGVGQICREERSLANGANVQGKVGFEAPTVTTPLLYTSASRKPQSPAHATSTQLFSDTKVLSGDVMNDYEGSFWPPLTQLQITSSCEPIRFLSFLWSAGKRYLSRRRPTR